MKLLAASAAEDLDPASPIVWTTSGPDPHFVFELAAGEARFIGFFLAKARGELAPKISFDQGSGFSELTAHSLKVFPFAFYHVAVDRMRDVRAIRFRPCIGPATFRFLPLAINSGVLVAILHYLFNLRYQKIGMVTSGERLGALAWIASNARRIARFFRDVSNGGGVRVQEGGAETLLDLRFFLSLEAGAVQADMDARLNGLTEAPLISFVSPVYNTAVAYLDDLLHSFAIEKAAYAELILSDDGSTNPATLVRLQAARDEAGVVVVSRKNNGGIAAATNKGLSVARGEWVSFIDHDDAFVPGAVAVITKAILDHPEAEFFYTDEIIADAALLPVSAFCKPAYDSVLLAGINYINHFSVFRRARVAALGGLRTDREGSQDYDLLLRYLADAAPGSVLHIPYLAYTWRREEASFSVRHAGSSAATARLSLGDAMRAAGRRGSVAEVGDGTLHRVCYADCPKPLITVVIPNKDSLALISRVVADLRERTDYAALDIVIVDNGSRDRAVLAFYADLQRQGFARVSIEEHAFDFAAMCNRGARLGRGDAILFLNNDIEVEAADWLDEMVECLTLDAVGIVGARLLYPNGLVQHNGVIVGLGGAAGHWYGGEPADKAGPMNRFAVRQTLSAVTGACMLVSRACFEAVGGFDAEAFPIAFNDVDLCLRARALGFRTVWTPFAQLVHHESISRGSDETGANHQRFLSEMARLQARHATVGYVDDAYSPLLDPRYSTPHFAVPASLPAPRPNAFS